MKEYTVRRFFEGEYGPAELLADFPGTVTEQGTAAGTTSKHLDFEPMRVKFTVAPAHIVRLIDASLADNLPIEILATIADWLDGNPHFNFSWEVDTPEGERISDVLFWLGTPEVNYPLTSAVLSKVRHYLVTGENLLTIADTKHSGPGA